jgi:ABC-type Fe3+/spermidine/putrescine transport system ATPase subunit
MAGRKLSNALENKFEGVVEEDFFKGSFLIYRILVGNRRVTVNVPNVDASSRLRRSDRVEIGWDRDASVVVPA